MISNCIILYQFDSFKSILMLLILAIPCYSLFFRSIGLFGISLPMEPVSILLATGAVAIYAAHRVEKMSEKARRGPVTLPELMDAKQVDDAAPAPGSPGMDMDLMAPPGWGWSMMISLGMDIPLVDRGVSHGELIYFCPKEHYWLDGLAFFIKWGCKHGGISKSVL